MTSGTLVIFAHCESYNEHPLSVKTNIIALENAINFGSLREKKVWLTNANFVVQAQTHSNDLL